MQKQQLKLIVRNTPSVTTSPTTQRHFQTLDQHPSLPQLQNRLRQLNGNLKILQQKYRGNLKQGFDNKIKTYRLQAVADRKILKQAIEESRRVEEHQQRQQKHARKQQQRQLDQKRMAMMMFRREQQFRISRQRNQRQKRAMTMTMRERNNKYQATKKVMHDRIIAEAVNKDKKKVYMNVVRQIGIHQQNIQAKQELFTKLLRNTIRLKGLRQQLQSFNGESQDDTFLTL